MVRICVVADELDMLHEWLDAVDPLRFHFNVVAQAYTEADMRSIERSASPDVWVCRRLKAAALRRCVSALSATPPSIVSISSDVNEAADAMDGTVSAVLVDGDSLWIVAAAVHAAHRRQFFVSPSVLERFRDGIVDIIRCPDSEQVKTLTPRELEVVQLLGEGLTNAAISNRLFVSAATISTHVLGVLRKLGASNRTEAALFALRNSRLIAERVTSNVASVTEAGAVKLQRDSLLPKLDCTDAGPTTATFSTGPPGAPRPAPAA